MFDYKVNELSSSVNNDAITGSARKLHKSKKYSDADSRDEEYAGVNHGYRIWKWDQPQTLISQDCL